MKKLALILALLLSILPLSACKPKDPLAGEDAGNTWQPSSLDYLSGQSNKADGDYLYYLGTDILEGELSSVELTTLWRYDIKTGKSEPACRDAACNHQSASSCPFRAVPTEHLTASTAVPHFAVRDGVIYYLTIQTTDAGKPLRDTPLLICSYNTKTLKYSELGMYQPMENYLVFQIAGEHLYYVQDVPHGEDLGVDTHLFRVPLGGGAEEKLFMFDDGSTTARKGILPIKITEDRCYMERFTPHEDDPETVSVTVLSYENRPDAMPVEHLTLDIPEPVKFSFDIEENVLYYEEWLSARKFNYCAVDLASGEKETLLSGVGPVRRCGEYLFYCIYEEVSFLYPGTDQTVTRRNNGKFAIKNLVTGEETLYTSKYPFDFGHSYNYQTLYRGVLYTSIVPNTPELLEEYGEYETFIAYDIEKDSFTEVSMGIG